MKNRILAITVATILLFSTIMFAIPITPTIAIPTEINVPADYLTIQAAMTAAGSGDTILVSPGTYVGAVVYKNVTIQGASGGASIISPGVPYKGGSTLLTAFRLNASASGAEIRGFTVDCNASENYYFAIFSRNASNIIIDSLTVNGAVQGITNWGGNNWEITDNVLNGTEAAGGGGIGIFLGAYPPSYPECAGNLIQNNTIWSNATAPDYSTPGICLALDVRWGAYDSLTGNEDISGNQIIDNTIGNLGYATGVGIEVGVIGVQGNATQIANTMGYIHDNTVSSNDIDNSYLGVYFYVVTNLTVEYNEIHNCNAGVHIDDGLNGSRINYNNIYNNGVGINNTAGEIVDTNFNWWGDASGPYNSDTNPGGLGDAVTSNVTYSPWLGSAFGTVPMMFYVDPTGTIQDAIDTAGSGDTILVSPGTYVGAVVYKNVTIQGASGGASIISPGVPYKGGSTLLTAFRLNASASGAEIRGFTVDCNASENYYFAIFSRNASNIIIDSLTVNGAVQGITNWGGNNWEITDNVLNGTEAAGGGGIGIFLGAYPPSYPECAGNLIQNNTIWSNATAPDYSTPGICLALDVRWGAYDSLTGNEDISGNQIIDNTIGNLGYATGVGIEVGVIGVQGNATQIANTMGYIHDNTVSSNDIDNSYLGVYFYVVTNLTVEYNEIHNCNAGVHIDDGLNGSRINYNNIYNNGVGINNTAGEIVDAKFNWWGNETGPYHPTLNPTGDGDEVTDDILFENWLLAPYPPPLLSPILYIDPPEVEFWTLSYGEEFSINVKIDNVTNLAGFDFKLYWDTDLLNLTSATSIIPWSGSHMVLANETDEVAGVYWLAIGAFSSPTFNGSTTLATLTFTVTYDPIHPENRTCAFDLSERDLSAPNGVPIPHIAYDGQYSIYSTRPRIEVQPSSYSAHALGETFIVNITINDVVDLYNFTFKLSYNTTMLDVLNMQIGPFLNSPVYQSTYVIDDANGYVFLTVWSTGGAAPASGSGVLASITFQASLATMWTTVHSNIMSCSLHLYETALKTNLGIDIPHDTSDGTYNYEPKPGDLDYDGCVGLADLRIIAYYYGAYDTIADVDEDSDVDIYDFTLVASHYGEC